ncbi:MAG: S-methyl-5'-thioadenosine phosphorylase, partial [Candidatus Omnitrophica bacterium]|nr:S-methyl-5'-thioadenosine phosphorylase [Candidatus Omnitrophota bacterium]
DVIGMTNLAEARLAREAGMCYATIALVTDYDCWHSGQGMETVSVEMVMENVAKNIETAEKIIKNTITNLPPAAPCGCHEALKGAIMTPREAIPRETIAKLGPIIEGILE